MRSISRDAFLIGEVWEDASNKISYGKRRRYFTDGELDSVMNYPVRSAIIDFIKGDDCGEGFMNTVMTIAENYPKDVVDCLMNMLSTHDTERILTVLSSEDRPMEREARAVYKMSDKAKEEAILRLRAATFLQFVLPGIPCIFYGDEIGTEGFEDPFCRSYFDWKRVEGNTLCGFFGRVAAMRNYNESLRVGTVSVRYMRSGVLCVERRHGICLCRAYVNVGDPYDVTISGEVIFWEHTEISSGSARLCRYGFLLEKIIL